MFIVEYGVKGAMRVNRREYDTLTKAAQFAERWRRTNSIGSYWAEVYDDGDGAFVTPLKVQAS